MHPALAPENIYAHRHEEQDVILWYNRALWHSIVSTSNTDDRES
jgi:alpha-ketoglutarate-dependent taurine dioxygenase